MRLFAQPSTSRDPASDALHGLAARGLGDAGGAKPLLLRALTDLFVMRPTHTADEIRQFAEIAQRLVTDASASDCDHAAQVLCTHPAAPTGLMDRLARRGGASALDLFARCRALSTPVLLEAASRGPTEVASAIAARPDLDAALIATLAARPEVIVIRALAANEAAPLGAALTALVARARLDAELARSLATRLPHRPETLGLFLHADTRARTQMVARARESAGEAQATSFALEHGAETALRRLEATALEGASPALAKALADACRCSEADAAALIGDRGGEPLALALRALGLRPDLVTRLILHAQPDLSQTPGHASALARLAAGLSQRVAQRVLDAILDRETPKTRHTPLHDPNARPSTARATPTQTRAPRSAADLLKRPA